MADIPQFLSLEDTHATYRPVGEYTFDEAVDMIDEAIAYCRTNEIRGLLIDIRGVTGIPPPSLTQRFHFATKWAATAEGRVTVAMISRPELVDPEHIGVTMANNRGLRTDLFTAEPDALAWLRTACS